ncbi:MAG: sigma-70 family RNA polymerase sigma factor [Bacteroidaceae bacterium]|nr:sigma-70 family RNA polymerase sigma factor [Bacteroidaceae bacterium]MBR1788809.1 sigma-70 family RNA polymerase sigma factor [Bacteroidaceae bacterium]
MGKMQSIDDAIIRRVLQGRTEEFRFLVRRHSADVVSFVGRMIPRAEDVEEVVQDTFVAAYRSLASYEAGRASFSTWLSRIAYYTALHWFRDRREATIYLEDNEALLARISDEEADRLWEEAPENEAERLDMALMQLKAGERMLVHLFYYEGKSLAEIGYILGVEPGTLATRLCRIRKKLYIIIKGTKK